jgi:hypothetical protein
MEVLFIQIKKEIFRQVGGVESRNFRFFEFGSANHYRVFVVHPAIGFPSPGEGQPAWGAITAARQGLFKHI